MGTSSAPTYANILLGEIDEKLKNLALSLTVSSLISLYNRFIDDISTIWTGTVEMLELILDKINNIHPTLKLTFFFPVTSLQPFSMTAFATQAALYHS